MNKSSIDRGLFRSFFYRTYKEELKQNNTSSKEYFEIPKYKETVSMKNIQYDHLGEDGIGHVGEYVDAGKVIIGKTIDLNKPSALGHTKKDCSTVVRHNEGGYVDKVMITSNENGMTLVKSVVRSMRTPEIGDKFSSRHAQKGTIGMIYNQEDMPYTEEGIVPDIIINPHALPSRMTIAQLIECVMGKVCCITGRYGDATPFTDMKPEDIIKELEKLGYEKNGSESMSHGMTGIKMEGKVFIGPTYYQRLKHMVNDKIHSRSRGPVQMLTRQPVEGRSRDGGLRFGEMERDCIISHGASAFLKERLFDHSDAYSIPICVKCGIVGVYNYKDNYGYCKVCNNESDIKMMQVPYACKLLFQELMSMSIHCKIV
jgi:DNA-directed RNA polymerase II subunit RPB2